MFFHTKVCIFRVNGDIELCEVVQAKVSQWKQTVLTNFTSDLCSYWLKINLSLLVKNIVQYSVLFIIAHNFFFKNPFVLGSGQRSSAVVHSGSQDPSLMSCLCWSQTVSAEESTSSPETEIRDEEKTCTGNTGTYWQQEGWLNILVCYRKQDQQMKQCFCLICAHIHHMSIIGFMFKPDSCHNIHDFLNVIGVKEMLFGFAWIETKTQDIWHDAYIAPLF